MTSERSHQVRREERREVRRLQVHRPAGHLAAHDVPIQQLNEDSFEDGFGFDGSSIRGWQPINASDMLLIPDPTTAKIDPFTQYPTLSLICNIVDPITKRAVLARPAQHRQEGREVPQVDRHRRHLLLRPRGRVLRLRRRPLRLAAEPVVLLHRLRRGALELGPRGVPEPRLQADHKGGYFPVPPTDSLADLRAEMVHDAAGGRHPRRGAAPRGRHRRAVRDRHALSADARRWPTRSCGSSTSSRTSRAATARRRRSCRSRSSATTARACTATSRSGRTRSRSSPATATPACRRRRSTTSAASSSTPRPSAPSPTRRRTATAG